MPPLTLSRPPLIPPHFATCTVTYPPCFPPQGAEYLSGAYLSLKGRVPEQLSGYVAYAEKQSAAAVALAQPYVQQYLTPEFLASVDGRMDTYLTRAEELYAAKLKPAVDARTAQLAELKESYLTAVEKGAAEIKALYADKVAPQLTLVSEAVADARAKGVTGVAAEAQAKALASVASAWNALIRSPQYAAAVAAGRPMLKSAAVRYNEAVGALNASETFMKYAKAFKLEHLPVIPLDALEAPEEEVDEEGDAEPVPAAAVAA